MARLSIEFQALTDPRFAVLGAELGAAPEFAQAVGLYHAMRIWSYCTQRSTYTLKPEILDVIQRGSADALVKADLAVLTRDGFRIKGTSGRVEWLEKLRESNRIRQRRARKRHALVTRDNPGALTPALALTPTTKTKTPDLVLASQVRLSKPAQAPVVDDRVELPKQPRPSRIKPSTLVSPERLAQLQEDFDKLYGFYPRHVGKDLAWKAFVKLSPDLDQLRLMALDIKRRVESGEWEPAHDDRKRFIPHLSTYLNQRRWTDFEDDHETG